MFIACKGGEMKDNRVNINSIVHSEIGICEDEKVDFIDMQGILEKSDLYDGLHPNEKGHEKIHKRIKEHLDNNLK